MYSVLPRVPVKLETAVVWTKMQRHQFVKFRRDLPYIFQTFSSSKRVLVDVGSFAGRVRSMRSGKELILATKPYAVDYPLRSWWHVLSTTLFLAIAIFGTIWNFDPAGRIVCSVLAGFLILRLFVIYHDQQQCNRPALWKQVRLWAGSQRISVTTTFII
jgi:hypothetical protein